MSCCNLVDRWSNQFQSTHPVWGATVCRAKATIAHTFQSTHPVWGATASVEPIGHSSIVSIHAPRVGCDINQGSFSPSSIGFNPRTPCGVRHELPRFLCPGGRFQSTHPVWGATKVVEIPDDIEWVSIHAPRVGCDDKPLIKGLGGNSFNPRTPCGVRHASASSKVISSFVSIHAPRVGCDDDYAPGTRATTRFNPRTPCGVRHADFFYYPCFQRGFNPRTPCGVRLFL